MLNSVSILIQVCERASRVSQLPILCLFPLNITISLLTIQCDVFYNIP
jgi:hypothetical protein